MDHLFYSLVLGFSLKWTLRKNLGIEIKIGTGKAPLNNCLVLVGLQLLGGCEFPPVFPWGAEWHLHT